MLRAGTRVRMKGWTWPERNGCEGVIVPSHPDGRYPKEARGYVLVLLDDDPLWPDMERERWWTCQVTPAEFEVIPS